MIRNAMVLVTLFLCATPVAAQQDAIILFYRPSLLNDSDQNPTIYAISNGGNRKLATISKGEFLALKVVPGVHAFSWTGSPARGQQTTLNVIPGQRVFLQVQFRSITQTTTDTAPTDFQALRPINATRVFDSAVLLPLDSIQFTKAAGPASDAPAQEGQPGTERGQSEQQQQAASRQPRKQKQDESPRQAESQQRPASQQQSATPQQAVSQRQRNGSTRTREIKIHGYVTAITSPQHFEIEDYRITRDDAFKLEFENPSPDLSFKIEDLRVGTELEIKGNYDDEKGELRAMSMKVDMDQFRKLKDTAILDRSPSGVEHIDGGWKGIFFVNGQRIQVTPETKVVFKLTSQEKKAAKAAKDKRTGSNETAPEDEFRPLSTLTEITSGMLMTYEGKRDVETGKILADRVEFSKNDFEKGEERLWNQLKVKVKPGNAQTFKPGDLSISQVGKFKLLPNEEVQAYVTKIGESLIPEYLKAIPDSDPSKLHFQFYVVINKEPNAFALANGVFVIHSGMFDVAENEAQLAAVIGHEIAHATQEHTWREMNYHKNALLALSIASAFAGAFGKTDLQQIGNMIEGAVRTGYSRALENQADRIGLQYMVQAGYDPREAPRLWKEMTKAYGLQTTNIFWSTHDNQATRRSYLMNEIKNNYADLNYSDVHTEENSLRQIRGLVKEAISGRQKIKITD